tara:strand:- start:1560 stop:1784 length:225 start_codon:yes stop_codon:yes gene_type:complete
MCLQLREALSVGKLHFCTDFFSTTQGLREAKEQLESEMRNYCVLVEASKTPFGKGALAARRSGTYHNVSFKPVN